MSELVGVDEDITKSSDGTFMFGVDFEYLGSPLDFLVVS
jgi:hypothetical protein